MDLYEKIKSLAANRKISIRQLEESLGFGNGVINRWRTTTPGVDKIEKVADFFDVTIDSLLDREQSTKPNNQSTPPTVAQQIMMRMDTDDLSEDDLDEVEKEMERFLKWRLEEIKRERSEKD